MGGGGVRWECRGAAAWHEYTHTHTHSLGGDAGAAVGGNFRWRQQPISGHSAIVRVITWSSGRRVVSHKKKQLQQLQQSKTKRNNKIINISVQVNNGKNRKSSNNEKRKELYRIGYFHCAAICVIYFAVGRCPCACAEHLSYAMAFATVANVLYNIVHNTCIYYTFKTIK